MKVSVICTNFNKGSWIGDALDSFLEQKTAFPFEIIVVDDASSDESPEIIRQYAKNYPEKIRAVFNETNKGIAKTWIDICQEAKGDYIARCDGDDYWTDPYKLQKQVDLLEKNPNSKWSNTEFDMVDSQGNVTQADVFKNKVIPLIRTYEDMLALKGMTMASTWLVESDLMREVNAVIDSKATDDTYNLQLELFKRTELSFLEDSTTVYRMGENSDSRPDSESKMFQRVDGLLKAQLTYLEANPDRDILKVSRALMEQGAEQEKRIIHLSNEIHRQQKHIDELVAEVKETHRLLKQEVDSSLKAHHLLDQEREKSKQYLAEKKLVEQDYQKVIHSKRWSIPTKIINFFRRK